MSAGWRRFMLFLHVTVSVAFPGAVACFFVLALAGLRGGGQTYAVMNLITLWVIVPLCILSLITGTASSLGTPWGLVRHYWVVVKLVLSALSTLALLVHLTPIRQMAALTDPASMPALQLQLVLASGVAVLVLLLLTALSVYKPRGLTPYGVRRLAS